MMHNWMMYNFGGGWIMIAWWVITVAAVVLFFKLMPSGWNQNNNPYPEDTALDILRKRYANGEISREEYEERREVLKQR